MIALMEITAALKIKQVYTHLTFTVQVDADEQTVQMNPIRSISGEQWKVQFHHSLP